MLDLNSIKRYNLPIHNPEKKYYKGYSRGRDVFLYYKENGMRRVEVIKNFDFYFLITLEDFKRQHSFLETQKHVKRVLKFSKHPYCYNQQWIRVHVAKRYEFRYPFFTTNCEPGEWNKLENIESLIETFEKKGIKCYEADVSLLHRFLADNEITFEDNLKRLYFDLETDDSRGGFDEESLKSNRILSFACYNDEGKSYVFMSPSNNDRGERDLLLKFYDIAKRYDVLTAWNGANFDFKVLRYRMMAHKLGQWSNLEWQLLHCDLLQAAKRNTPSGEYQSYSLKNIGEKVLGISKLNLDGRKIIQLYNTDKIKLKQYNLRDAELLYKIEERKGYHYNDVRTGILASRFCNYYNISTKVEGALLKEGNRRGVHYKTLKREERLGYAGGYVQAPEVGIYDDVATMDFKSLYPSLIQTFNISHDTIVEDRDDKNLISTPVSKSVGCKFKRDEIGVLPGILALLNERRYYYQDLMNKEEHGSDKYHYYYWVVAAHKTMNLSFYGELGNSKGRFYDIRLAKSVTLSGQFYNKFAAYIAKKMGYKALYSDTDSLFIQIPRNETEEFLRKVHENFDILVKKFNSFPALMKIEHENYYNRVAFLAKKRYFGSLIIHKGKECKPFIYARGLEVRRNDVPDISKNFQNKIMQMIMIERKELKDVLRELKEIRERVINNKVTKEEIICYQSISKAFNEYTGYIKDSKTGLDKIKKDGERQKKSMPIHVKIAKKLHHQGKEFFVGMQIPYIITSMGPLDGVHEDDFKGEYDKEYYFNNRTYEPVKRIFEVVWPKYDWDQYYVDNKK